MPNIQPIQQPCLEDLKNALTIAEMGRDRYFGVHPPSNDAIGAFGDIARLIRHALEQLGEPNLAAIQAGEVLLKEWQGTPDERRSLRDTIQGILTAQLSGIVPKTWERD